MCPLYCQTSLFLQHQARLDQCKVTMETLEKQLEEEKHKAQLAESQRGAGTGKKQETLFSHRVQSGEDIQPE